MLRNVPISRRLSLLIVLGAGVILSAVVLATVRTSRRTLEEELEAKTGALAVATANRIGTVLRSVEQNAVSLAVAYDHAAHSEAATYDLIDRFVAVNPEVYGAAIALEPGRHGRATAHWAPYVYRDGTVRRAKNLADGGYNYVIWDWYLLPRYLRQGVWTEPYFDEGGGGVIMATFSVPLLDQDQAGAVRGVVTSDLSLSWLTTELSSLPLGVSGYAFLISANGTFIAHPNRRFIMNETVFSVAEERHDPALRELGRRMTRGASGFGPHRSLVTGESSWLAFVPVTPAGWSLAVVLPDEVISSRLRRLSALQLGLGAAGLLLLTCLVVVAASAITRPLRQLERATTVLASGDLGGSLPTPRGSDEVAHLVAAFGAMQSNLRRHIAELAAATAARERIESDLRVAHEIQMSLVPMTFPPVPSRPEIDLYAMLQPARQVGGDFYDFFWVDDQTLCLAVGDVAGKGVPAALYMAVTRTLLRAAFRESTSLPEILRGLNEDLARDNDSCMFVTLFCALVDVPSGRIAYSSGGHPPPFVLHPDGRLEQLPLTRGAALGAFGRTTFGEGTVQLGPGDAVYAFTDGVSEAMNPLGELFGEERAAAALSLLHGRTARELVEAMYQAVCGFTGGAEQSDDITMLVFRYTGLHDTVHNPGRHAAAAPEHSG